MNNNKAANTGTVDFAVDQMVAERGSAGSAPAESLALLPTRTLDISTIVEGIAPRQGDVFALVGVPFGARLSAGVRQDDGPWIVAADQVSNLKMTLPEGFSSDFCLIVFSAHAGPVVSVDILSEENGDGWRIAKHAPILHPPATSGPNAPDGGNTTFYRQGFNDLFIFGPSAGSEEQSGWTDPSDAGDGSEGAVDPSGWADLFEKW